MTGLKRSGPPQRKTPLSQGTSQLTRSAPMARTSSTNRESRIAGPAKAKPRLAPKESPLVLDPTVILWSESALRKLLVVRSGGRCEARLSGCTGGAVHMCHRVTDGMGGRPLADDLRLSNVWHGCAACHMWTHHQPTQAKDMGLMLENWQKPSAERIAYQGRGWFLLNDDGTIQKLYDEPTVDGV